MLTSDNFIFERMLKFTGFTFDNRPFYHLNEVKDSNLAIETENSVDVTDAQGAVIETLKFGQRGTFSANGGLFNWSLFAAQSGDQRETASATKKLVMPQSEKITVTGKSDKPVLLNTPVGTAGAEIGYIMRLNADGTMKDTIKQGTVAATGVFALDVATKTITLPTDIEVGDVLVVNYDAESETGFKITKDAIKQNAHHKAIGIALGHEPCDQNTSYAVTMKFPSARLNNEISIDFAPDMDHPFEVELTQGYCDAKKVLYEIYVDSYKGE